jgi:hypothetical protein
MVRCLAWLRRCQRVSVRIVDGSAVALRRLGSAQMRQARRHGAGSRRPMASRRAAQVGVPHPGAIALDPYELGAGDERAPVGQLVGGPAGTTAAEADDLPPPVEVHGHDLVCTQLENQRRPSWHRGDSPIPSPSSRTRVAGVVSVMSGLLAYPVGHSVGLKDGTMLRRSPSTWRVRRSWLLDVGMSMRRDLVSDRLRDVALDRCRGGRRRTPTVVARNASAASGSTTGALARYLDCAEPTAMIRNVMRPGTIDVYR